MLPRPLFLPLTFSTIPLGKNFSAGAAKLLCLNRRCVQEYGNNDRDDPYPHVSSKKASEHTSTQIEMVS
jgi:hypothetical protein